MSRRAKVAVAVLGVLLALVAAGAALALSGGLDVAPRGRDATRWSRACYRQPARGDRVLLERCVRVTGRVVHVRTQVGRRTEIHAALVVDFGIVLVKLLDPPPGAAPKVGERYRAVGPLVRSRSGLREVQAFAVRGDPDPIVPAVTPRPRRRP